MNESAPQVPPECEGKDPRGCWNVRCQLGKVCCRRAAPQAGPSVAATELRDELCMLADQIDPPQIACLPHTRFLAAAAMRKAAAALAALPLPAVVQAAPGDVHPAAPQTTAPTAAPRSEPRALGQGELPVRALYDELLFAVGSKFPGETRHQTALRYIRNAEKSCDSRAALSAPGGGGRA